MFEKNKRFITKIKMTPNCLFSFEIQHEKYHYLAYVFSTHSFFYVEFFSNKKYVSNLSINTPSNVESKEVMGDCTLRLVHINIPTHGDVYFITFY